MAWKTPVMRRNKVIPLIAATIHIAYCTLEENTYSSASKARIRLIPGTPSLSFVRNSGIATVLQRRDARNRTYSRVTRFHVAGGGEGPLEDIMVSFKK